MQVGLFRFLAQSFKATSVVFFLCTNLLFLAEKSQFDLRKHAGWNFLKYLYFEWGVKWSTGQLPRLKIVGQSKSSLVNIINISFSWCRSFLLISWVEESWVSELSIVVLGVELGDDNLGLLDEVVNVDEVRNVGVEVVLEVLDHVHTGLNALVSPHSWERERLVKKFPGVDSWWLHSELAGNLHSVQVVLLLEVSGELIHLPIHLVLWDPESWLASTSLWGQGINNSIIALELNQVMHILLGGGDVSEENQCNKGVFHFINYYN